MEAAQEKAQELIDRFSKIQLGETKDGLPFYMPLHEAKQCAIIHVEEILNMEVWDWPHNTPEGKLFYEEVKEQILIFKYYLHG
jgi:hypothetical protein